MLQKEEAELEKLREKERIRAGKELLEAKRKEDDLKLKRNLELRRIEKEEEQRARDRIRVKLGQCFSDSAPRSAPQLATTFGLGSPTCPCFLGPLLPMVHLLFLLPCSHLCMHSMLGWCHTVGRHDPAAIQAILAWSCTGQVACAIASAWYTAPTHCT